MASINYRNGETARAILKLNFLRIRIMFFYYSWKAGHNLSVEPQSFFAKTLFKNHFPKLEGAALTTPFVFTFAPENICAQGRTGLRRQYFGTNLLVVLTHRSCIRYKFKDKASRRVVYNWYKSVWLILWFKIQFLILITLY